MFKRVLKIEIDDFSLIVRVSKLHSKLSGLKSLFSISLQPWSWLTWLNQQVKVRHQITLIVGENLQSDTFSVMIFKL